MREVWFIRHGESESNAGLLTKDYFSTPLTSKGFQQATSFAKTILHAPDKIIMSKFLRTQQTAQPIIDKFPNTPFDVWDVHEFTYLNPEKYNGTTVEQRRPAAMDYWNNHDPHHIDGDGAESFIEFCQRGEKLVEQIKSLNHELTFIFSHGLFIKMVCHLMQGIELKTTDGMKYYRSKESIRFPHNNEVVKIKTDGHQFFYDFDFLKN